MMIWKEARVSAVILIIWLTLLPNACVTRPSTENLVVTEYLLKQAGFQPLPANITEPKRQALLEVVPKGKIMAFKRGGESYYTYADQASQTLYVGDEAAYQKYLSIAKGRQVCERVDASNSAPFWSCFDELKAGKR